MSLCQYILNHKVDYAYDTLGRRTSMSLMNNSTPLGATQYTYDTMSRLATVSDGTNTATYARIAGMNLLDTTTVSNTSGTVLTRDRNYDSYHRLASISNTAGSVTRSYTYTLNDKDQRTRITFADGSYWDYTYDAKGQVISGAKYDANGLAVPGQAFGYGYDEIGNMLYKENGMSALKIAYSSNIVNQYTAVAYPGVVPVVGAADVDAEVKVMRNDTPQNYYPLRVMTPTRNGKYYYGTFSADNSQTEKTVDYSVYAMKTDPNDTGKKLYEKQNGSFTVPKRDAAFTYDDDGNMLTNGDWTYTWNGENRMIAAEKSNSKLEFAYDYQGRRFSKKVYTGTTGNWTLSSEQKFVYDRYLQIAEFNGSNSVQKSHVWADSTTLEWQKDHVNSKYHYCMYDGNKNIIGTVDDTETLTSSYEYSPFGKILSKSGSYADSNKFRFSSEYQDDETGLVYYNYRYYSSEIGRWTKRDPIEEEGGYNLYGMVGNRIANYFDYLGYVKVSHSVNYEYFNNLSELRKACEGNRLACSIMWGGIDDVKYKTIVNPYKEYIKHKPCCVTIDSVKWHSEIKMLTRSAWDKEVGDDKYARWNRNNGYNTWTNEEFYKSRLFKTYDGVFLHEKQHMKQFKELGEKGINIFNKKFTEANCKDDANTNTNTNTKSMEVQMTLTYLEWNKNTKSKIGRSEEEAVQVEREYYQGQCGK